MINFIKELWSKFLNNKKIKIFTSILLVLYIAVVCICTIKINKEIITPGVLNNPSYFLTIGSEEEGGVNETGDINTIGVYVTYQPTIFQYLLSLPNNGFEISDYTPGSDLSPSDQTARSTYLKDISIDYALITAYEKAHQTNPSINISKEYEGMLVTAVLPNAFSQELKIGDIIIGVKIGGNVSNLLEIDGDYMSVFRELIKDHQTFTFVIKDGTTTKEVTFGFADNSLGIEVYPSFNITSSTPTYSIDKATVHNSIGSSGGMMLTLSIYNSLFTEDITKGLMICGTGTVDLNGKIGAIGGIAQKIQTAQLYKADVFFCPFSDESTDTSIISNYNEAKAAYDAINNPCFELVKIRNFDDVLDYLDKVVA